MDLFTFELVQQFEELKAKLDQWQNTTKNVTQRGSANPLNYKNALGHGMTRRMPLLPDPLIQLHHSGAQFRYRPLHPIIPVNNHNKSNNARSNTNNNTRTIHHRIDNKKFQQIKATARLIYKKTQLTHHIDNWKENRAKILKTTINNLKDNINPPNKNNTFNQSISIILDNTYETIKSTIINHLNNKLSNYHTIHYKNIDLIDDTKPIKDHIRFLQGKKNFHHHKNNIDNIIKNEIEIIKTVIFNNNNNNNDDNTKNNTNNKNSNITSTTNDNHNHNNNINNMINNNNEYNNNNNNNQQSIIITTAQQQTNKKRHPKKTYDVKEEEDEQTICNTFINEIFTNYNDPTNRNTYNNNDTTKSDNNITDDNSNNNNKINNNNIYNYNDTTKSDNNITNEVMNSQDTNSRNNNNNDQYNNNHNNNHNNNNNNNNTHRAKNKNNNDKFIIVRPWNGRQPPTNQYHLFQHQLGSMMICSIVLRLY
ncbi:hypothetical protein HELRODRAFT_183579 [Helobdella robusta]|uniref:Uncharacterized protein n=1 Tax=Helobdella robusta TaxID=6412 RepID=T1FJV2_HELRO|nr:hypothetical protein HELRODRAFT_183579 [Helobdella robusta]ESO10479.1 hypothetical protein HELRODRAFT_183579 [Helobdella robusta]